MWKEKMRIHDAERFDEISRKHQAQCKKWWDKLTPEQRREKRKQWVQWIHFRHKFLVVNVLFFIPTRYNLKWRQNQKKAGDASDSSDGSNWAAQSYGTSNTVRGNENGKTPTPSSSSTAGGVGTVSATEPYYSKSNNGPVFNVVSGSVVYPFSYFPFRSIHAQVPPQGRGATS